MTETTTAQSIADQIDQMVGPLSTSTGRARNSTSDVRVEIDRDSGAILTATVMVPVAHPEGLKDFAGLELTSEISNMDNAIVRINAELAEVVSRDRDGKPTYRYSAEARTNREVQLKQLVKSRDYQKSVNDQLQLQRNAKAAEAVKAKQEEAARYAHTGGDPKKADLLQQKIDEAEAVRMANLIVKNRHDA